jgi:hypothetical protein
MTRTAWSRAHVLPSRRVRYPRAARSRSDRLSQSERIQFFEISRAISSEDIRRRVSTASRSAARSGGGRTADRVARLYRKG